MLERFWTEIKREISKKFHDEEEEEEDNEPIEVTRYYKIKNIIKFLRILKIFMKKKRKNQNQ